MGDVTIFQEKEKICIEKNDTSRQIAPATLIFFKSYSPFLCIHSSPPFSVSFHPHHSKQHRLFHIMLSQTWRQTHKSFHVWYIKSSIHNRDTEKHIKHSHVHPTQTHTALSPLALLHTKLTQLCADPPSTHNHVERVSLPLNHQSTSNVRTAALSPEHVVVFLMI